MAEAKQYDIAIIGAGPGGYVAAIVAAQKGKKVALIEKDFVGGSCLNYGCIPTKTLISNAQVLKKISHAKDYGINIGSVSFDYAHMKNRKDKVVSQIRTSLAGLFKSNGIDLFIGKAQFESAQELKVVGQDSAFIKAHKIIIASGSTTLDLKAFPCDHKRIVNSTSILEMTTLPKKLAIIGGGYIGCEFASLYADLGVEVTIIEALPAIIAAQGKKISEFLTKAFVKKGIIIKTNTSVQKIDNTNSGIVLLLSDGSTLESDIALVSVGRKTVVDSMCLEKIGLGPNERGYLEVNNCMETKVPNVYAIGDVTGKSMLAHVASHQGIVAAKNACGEKSHMHYHAVPAVIFTQPEIAMVGYTLEQALAAGLPAKAGTFPFTALPKSITSMDTEGFSEVVINEKTGAILGAQIAGYEASALIGEMALAIQNELTIECLVDTIHAHPTTAEAWLEAGFLAMGAPIHFPPKTKR